MPGRRRSRRAYLLRCWRAGGATGGGEPRWRFSLEEVLEKGPRRGFGSLEALVSFLRGELGAAGEGASLEGRPEGPPR